MFTASEQWRKEKKVDEIFESFKFDELPLVTTIYPRFYHKTDKLGRPIYIEVGCLLLGSFVLLVYSFLY